ncbi:MAG: sugar nucleotide-binding protein [Candidatus Omnitrophota bacterium]
MRILITGGTGLLGKTLIEKGDSRYEIMATYLGSYGMKDTARIKYKKLDIRDREGLRGLFGFFKPEAVIHTVSVGSPDFAEKNKEYTREVDVMGTGNILQGCNESGSKLVYISSNGIYAGNKAPYAETDKAEPVNYYGKIKLESEKIVEKSGITHAIVRPILLYGWNHHFERQNIVTIALRKLLRNEIVNVYEDVICNPLLVNCCAEAVWRIIDREIYQVFNIGGQDIVNIYQLVETASEVFGLDSSLVKPVRQGFFKEMVKRPLNTSYLTDKMESVLGVIPLSIREGLEIMRKSTPKNLSEYLYGE